MTDAGKGNGAGRLLTPSKITAWLDCRHHLTLTRLKESGELHLERSPFGSFAQLLADKGTAHETACLEDLRAAGRDVFEVPGRRQGERFDDWITRLGDVLDGTRDVVYQVPLVHDGIRGIADFVLAVRDPESGAVSWEPVDAKLARAEAKPGHVLQLCFYAEAIEALTGTAPEHLHLWLGSGRGETVRATDVMPYWRRLRSQLEALVTAEAPEDTRPEPCAHCGFCEFAEECESRWRAQDSLVYIAGLHTRDRHALETAGVDTLAGLATTDPDSGAGGLGPDRLDKLVAQAALQAEARTDPGAPPPFRVIAAGEGNWGHGFEALPAPDDGDVFLDIEGHPFWRPDTGLIFLFGWIAQENGAWTYRTLWAHDQDAEADAARKLVEYLVDRRQQCPGTHVYHYNHTERTSLERLTGQYGVAQAALADLVATGAFVDLLQVLRNAVQVGVESYGLKHVEHLTSYRRGHDIDQGAGAVLEYEQYMTTGDATSLDAIAAYNEDDVRATLALRDWLVTQRPAGLDWRPAQLGPGEHEDDDLDQRIQDLHQRGPGTPEQLLGDVLGYWSREGRVHRATSLARLDGDLPDQLDDPTVIAGLRCEGEVDPPEGGRARWPAMRFRFPDQTLLSDLTDRARVMWATPDGTLGRATIRSIDRDGTVDLVWNEDARDLGDLPSAVTHNDWISPVPKPASVVDLADRILDPGDHGAPNRAALALLRRDLPTFTSGHGPAGGVFGEDVDEMRAWAPHLDASFATIQGPPGTGKTYRGAQIVRSLIADGKRVGITAFSHAAIGNFLTEIVDEMDGADELDRLHAVQKVSDQAARPLPVVDYATTIPKAADPHYNLVAGTTWLFANQALRDHPVDVLIIDEAGQLSLADALAAACGARNLVLLGDPLQLAQVALALHPGRSGDSVLQHVLGDKATLPAERGVFLSETRRMHPDVCRFISDAIYDSRLTSHPDCARQGTAHGTGLRWLPVHHEGCATESAEEADAVAHEIQRILGTDWTDHHGDTRPLTASDVMVVAPYNDQVNLLRQRLAAEPATVGVPVGTVDKFQGQEAAVVFFTMTSSSAADAPRSTDFLFSRNRLNVAISRARCLAYLVCTEEIANSRARTVDEMRLFSTLCSFIEYATSS